MSKDSQNSQANPHAFEYSIIKRDLVKILALNCVYLAVILALYFSDKKTHFLENWFSKFLNF